MSTGPGMHTDRIDVRLVPAAATCWAVTASAILWHAGVGAAWVCLIVGAAAAVARRRVRRRDEPVRVVVATVVLGAALVGAAFAWSAALRVDALDRHPLTALYGRSAVVTVTASEQPRPLRAGGRVVFRASLRRIGADEVGGRVLVFAPARGFAELTAGRPANFRAFVARPRHRDMSVGVLTASGTPTLGQASGLQRAAEALRRKFAAAARAELPSDQAAALPALVLGDTAALPPETVASFRSAGLTHLTAVSGANVTIVCGAVLLSARLVGPRIAVAAAALALVGFVIVVQPSPSVLRAAMMGAIALLAVLTHRRRHAMPALASTVICLMIVAPEMSVDLGFALSVSATAALIVVAPAWSRGLVSRGWPKLLADTVSVAAAAQLVTAPLIAAVNGSLSVVSIIANVAVAAVIPPITVAGTAAAALVPIWPSAGQLLIRFTGPELWWLLGVAQWAGGVPGATLEVPSRLLGFVTVTSGAVASILLLRRLSRVRWAPSRRWRVAPSSSELDGTASGAGRRRTPRGAGDRRDTAPGAGPGPP